ncbi:MAG: LEA type 2 family protein [Candidatus Accumulibacter sp.]|jgi:LEA14-like dessication related protein|nr:LEA type 2 family protein [Accumulibacter sp.]
MSLKKMRAGAVFLLFPLLFAALSACGGAPRRPEVALEGIRLDRISFEDQGFLLRLRVRNPNAFDISIESLRFTLEVEGKTLASGTLGEAVRMVRMVRIPGGGDAAVEVAARGRLGAFFRLLRDYRKKGGDRKLAYRIHGDAGLAGFGELPFDRKATLDLTAWSRLGERGSPEKTEGPKRTEENADGKAR